ARQIIRYAPRARNILLQGGPRARLAATGRALRQACSRSTAAALVSASRLRVERATEKPAPVFRIRLYPGAGRGQPAPAAHRLSGYLPAPRTACRGHRERRRFFAARKTAADRNHSGVRCIVCLTGRGDALPRAAGRLVFTGRR